MDRAVLDGAELEYQIHGSGEPVVLIHPGIYADWFTPLLGEPILTTHIAFVLTTVSMCGEQPFDGPVSLAKHAAHCRSLMRLLGSSGRMLSATL